MKVALTFPGETFDGQRLSKIKKTVRSKGPRENSVERNHLSEGLMGYQTSQDSRIIRSTKP